MLRLAQGEVARGDRDAALRYLERLAAEAPESSSRAEAGLWQGRLLIDRGAREEGCLVLRLTRPRVPAGALELENQYDYLIRGCPERAVVSAPPVSDTSAPPISTPPVSTPPVSTPPTTPPATPPTAPPAGVVWSVQVAAFGTQAEAAEFAATIRARGYDTRVDGTVAPFRVRFGRYPTRAAAAAAMRDYQSKERADAFLAQVPRG
jgi:septal ring-binding cell division protein DamX